MSPRQQAGRIARGKTRSELAEIDQGPLASCFPGLRAYRMCFSGAGVSNSMASGLAVHHIHGVFRSAAAAAKVPITMLISASPHRIAERRAETAPVRTDWRRFDGAATPEDQHRDPLKARPKNRHQKAAADAGRPPWIGSPRSGPMEGEGRGGPDQQK